jgi:hypothetical protein
MLAFQTGPACAGEVAKARAVAATAAAAQGIFRMWVLVFIELVLV